METNRVEEKIQSIIYNTMQNKKISFTVENLSSGANETILIEPLNYQKSDLKEKLDGMQILYQNGIFEVSEIKAGKNEDQMHIFLLTRSFKIALRNMLKGNKRSQSKILEIIN